MPFSMRWQTRAKVSNGQQHNIRNSRLLPEPTINQRLCFGLNRTIYRIRPPGVNHSRARCLLAVCRKTSTKVSCRCLKNLVLVKPCAHNFFQSRRNCQSFPTIRVVGCRLAAQVRNQIVLSAQRLRVPHIPERTERAESDQMLHEDRWQQVLHIRVQPDNERQSRASETVVCHRCRLCHGSTATTRTKANDFCWRCAEATQSRFVIQLFFCQRPVWQSGSIVFGHFIFRRE